jgi:hypothetical protein
MVESWLSWIEFCPEAVRHEREITKMQGGKIKNWILPKEMNANHFFWDSHWLEIWSNHFCPSMGPNGGSVAMDSGSAIVGQHDEVAIHGLVLSIV